jgi:hypothetical protein
MSKTAGPALEIVMPKLDLVSSPFELFIRFVPNTSEPDPKSIQVIAKKWILEKFRGDRDISDSVRPYVTVEGIHVPKAEIPPGRYQIAFRITDISGRVSEGEVVLEITRK